MPGLLRLRCSACHTSFVSAHQERVAELRRAVDLLLTERCAHCGAEESYEAGAYVRGRLVGPCGPLVPGRDG